VGLAQGIAMPQTIASIEPSNRHAVAGDNPRMDMQKRPDHVSITPLDEQLAKFDEFGESTDVSESTVDLLNGEKCSVPTFTNQFWTADQREGNPLHEISYAACFKPALPRFFIERLTKTGQVVYDPFMGRGTTVLEAALTGRIPYGSDVNPLSVLLVRPRLQPPSMEQVRTRLGEIDLSDFGELRRDLRVFYHLETLKKLCALRKYFLDRQNSSRLDSLDEWIWMTMMTRLNGHFKSAFSRRSGPPDTNPTIAAQRRINRRNKAIKHPLYRSVAKEVPEILLKKTHELRRGCTQEVLEVLNSVAGRALITTNRAEFNPKIPNGTVSLVMTSPPFLKVVDYGENNWLRCWFAGIDSDKIEFAMLDEDEWPPYMTRVFEDLFRVLEPGGHVAFEVGEVKKGTIPLEMKVLPCGLAAGFIPLVVLINHHDFNKTVRPGSKKNARQGTNTNRVVIFQKPGANGEAPWIGPRSD
jgi:hypothetical protein